MRLIELRDATYQMAKKAFPNMPDYVIRDLVYQAAKESPEVLFDEDWQKDLGNLQWKKEALHITLDIFDKRTQQQLKTRAGGKSNPHNVKNDAARHETQQKMIASGPSQEPIIVMQKTDGYELLEGWHRTIQSMQQWPDGYKQIAWIGYK